MSIAKAISNFLHRAKDDVSSTEEELKKVLAVIEPEVTAVKNAVVDEVKDALPTIIEEVKGALSVVVHDGSARLTKELAVIHDRFDAIDAKLAMLRAESIQNASAVKKAAQNLKKQAATPAPEEPVAQTPQADEKSNTN